jgi:hypothetical protein
MILFELMILNKVTDLYKKYEKYISPISLIYGFIFTSLTLTRVDMPMENFWIIVNLLLVALGILGMTFYQNRAKEKNIPLEDVQKVHFYLTLVMQFAFGGLFSTFFVFYIRSSSVIQSWFFLLILLVLLVGNEVWKKRYERLVFQISVLFISLYLFLIFILPVLFHRLGADIFIISGITSLILIFLFLFLLKRIAKEKFQSNHHNLKISILAIFILMNVMYFTNIIPPIPLSLKASGAYHNIIKVTEGRYEGRKESETWWNSVRRYPVFHQRAGENVYAFSAIFSPIKLNTEIIHQWQYYNEVTKKWIDSSRIVLPISGGRDEGFRTYSAKQSVTPGLWRVKVMTTRGQVMGYINFKVERVNTIPDLILETL